MKESCNTRMVLLCLDH